MIALLCFFLTLFASPFKSKRRLEAENALLRRQLIILRRKVRGRVHLTNGDRLFLVQLYRWLPSVLNAIAIIPRPSSARIGPASGDIGVGNPAVCTESSVLIDYVWAAVLSDFLRRMSGSSSLELVRW
jgi:hypothetical protein